MDFVKVLPVCTINDDPQACSKATSDNFAKFAGAPPEISVPNSEMVAQVDALSIPFNQSLYKKIVRTDVVRDDPSGKLEDRISAATNRVLGFAVDTQEMQAVSDQNALWDDSLRSANDLVHRSEAMTDAIVNERKWPTIREFAPLAWHLAICARNNEALISGLKQKTDSDQKHIAYGFAFFSDWRTLLKPFNAFNVSLSLGGPFFVESEEIVKRRKDKSLFALSDVKSFKKALVLKIAELAPHVDDRKKQHSARILDFSSAFGAEKLIISTLRSLIEEERTIAEGLKKKVLASERRLNANADKQSSKRDEISAAAAILAKLIVSRDELRKTANTVGPALVKAKRDAIDKAQSTLDSIVLNCGGVSYQTCGNAVAKRDYDRERYTANEQLGMARQEYFRALEASVHNLDMLLAAEVAILRQQTSSSEKLTELSALVEERGELIADLNRVTVEAEKQSNQIQTLADKMARLDKAVAKIEASIPKNAR